MVTHLRIDSLVEPNIKCLGMELLSLGKCLNAVSPLTVPPPPCSLSRPGRAASLPAVSHPSTGRALAHNPWTNPADRVCIVGAGAAGVHMAASLKKRNYKDVRIDC